MMFNVCEDGDIIIKITISIYLSVIIISYIITIILITIIIFAIRSSPVIFSLIKSYSSIVFSLINFPILNTPV